jgi:hypothetical protein
LFKSILRPEVALEVMGARHQLAPVQEIVDALSLVACPFALS